MGLAKPFEISKWVVYEAYLQVKSNQGAEGVDRQSIQDFAKDLKNNLYKLWNRLSSGSYFPPAVLAVSIAKSNGGTRLLGVPTVADRIAQTVAKQYLEPLVEPYFHLDSYGYRPGKSALDAIGVTRKRCWRYDWVVDLDIKGFFDNLDHRLVMRAVEKHTNCKWILLYVERWLKTPMKTLDGQIEARSKGTPQGGVISPLLVNMLMHYVFDDWMSREHPNIPFERYADDAVVHCRSEKQACFIRDKIDQRLRRCKLELHPEKTRIVYCKDELRALSHQHTSFDFLGYTFRPRTNRTRHGKLFVNFSPAISDKAKKEIRQCIRKWKIHLWSGATLASIAREINPVVRGWVLYYGRFIRSEVRDAVQNIDAYLIRWAMGKYKRLRGRKRRASEWLQRIRSERCNLFVHWAEGFSRWAE
jgi:RNA-directed DNA polymerase